MSRNPLFDAMLVVQNNDHQPLHLHDLQMKPSQVSHLVSKFDLTLQASEGDRNIHFHFEYSTALFEKTTIERWASHLTNVLNIIVKNPEVTLNHIDILTQKSGTSCSMILTPGKRIITENKQLTVCLSDKMHEHQSPCTCQ